MQRLKTKPIHSLSLSEKSLPRIDKIKFKKTAQTERR